MIIKVILVNINYLTVLIFFLVIRTLSNFQIYYSVFLTIITILYITSPEFSYLINGSV